MARLHKISFLLFLAGLFFGISNRADATDLNHESDLCLAEIHHHSSIIPGSEPELVGIHRLGKSSITFIRIPPVQQSKKNSEEDYNSGLLLEIPIRRAASIYLNLSRDINQSLTIKELLFPFHHFL